MRPFALLCLTVGLFAAYQPARAAEPDRLADLIAGLGDEEFTAREVATAELERLGEAALPALRQALAVSDDLEVRRRAANLVERMDYRVAVQELGRLEGTWNVFAIEENGYIVYLDEAGAAQTVIRKGESVSTRNGSEFRWTWRSIDAAGTPCKADLLMSDGRVFRAIYRLDGDTLTYCGAYAEDESGRPTAFMTHDGDGRTLSTLKRAK